MKTFRQYIAEAMERAIHRTTPEAARQIRAHGFSLEYFGHGAGLGLFEEPCGVFLSRVDNDDFAKEVEDRGLKMSEVIEVEFPADKIWKPTRNERIATSQKLETEFIMQKYSLNHDEAEIVRRGMIGKMKQNPKLSDAFKDHVSNDVEIEFKKFFSKWLMDQGYTAVEWKEPVKGVNQVLVLDPKNIKVIKPKSDMTL